MTHYLIEFRFLGYSRRYLKGIIKESSRKFHIKGMKVPHVSLVGPLTLSRKPFPLSLFSDVNEKRLVNEFVDVIKKYNNTDFKLIGFDKFEKTRVVYVNILPSNNLKELRYELYTHLKKFCKLTEFDDLSKNDFKFHATIACKIPEHKFNSFYTHIKNKKSVQLNQKLIRVTLIKNQRILCEYDLIQKRLLNRQEAKSKDVYRQTIELMKQK